MTLQNPKMADLLAQAERLRKDSRAATPEERPYIERQREALRIRLRRMQECEPRPTLTETGRTDWTMTGLVYGTLLAVGLTLLAAAWR